MVVSVLACILLGIDTPPSPPPSPALLTVSRHGQLLRSWDLESGQLKYEVSTSLPPPQRGSPDPLDQSWRPGGVQATLAGKKGGECMYMYLDMYMHVRLQVWWWWPVGQRSLDSWPEVENRNGRFLSVPTGMR